MTHIEKHGPSDSERYGFSGADRLLDSHSGGDRLYTISFVRSCFVYLHLVSAALLYLYI